MTDEHEQVYGDDRARRLEDLLRAFAENIRVYDAEGTLLTRAPGLLRALGELRSELFHYEVRRTYDTPEIADHRRIVEEATRDPDFDTDEMEDG